MLELCKSRGLIPLFFIFVLSSIVYAAPPVFQVGQFTTGYSLEYLKFGYVLFNTTTKFQIHIFNISNGYPIGNQSTVCYLHLYNRTGSHILTMSQSLIEHDFDFEFIVGGGNFSKLDSYSLITQCNDSTQRLGGFVSYQVQSINQTYLNSINSIPEAYGTQTSKDDNRFMFWIIIASVYIFLLLSFIIKEPYIAMISSMAMIVIGVYSFNGINGITNYFTQAFSLINMALGGYILIRTSMEKAQEELG